jgi:hypothetical protein
VAGFEPALRPQPGGGTGIPAAFRYPAFKAQRGSHARRDPLPISVIEAAKAGKLGPRHGPCD